MTDFIVLWLILTIFFIKTQLRLTNAIQMRLECAAVLVRRFKVRNTNLLGTMSRLPYQRPVDFRFTAPGYTMSGGNDGGCHERHPKRKTIVEL